MLKALRILLLFPVLLSCGCRPTPEREGEVVLGEGALPLLFEVVGAGSQAQGAAPLEAVFYAAQTWDTLRPHLAFRRPVPPVDFSGAMVLVAVAEVPSSGYALRFERVEEDSVGVVAAYTLLTPGADCLTDPLPQQPFQAIRLRRTEGAVRFEHRRETVPCTLGPW